MRGRAKVTGGAGALTALLVVVPAGRAEAPVTPPPDKPPLVRFSGLNNGQVLPVGQPVVLNAVATDDNGVQDIRFLRNGAGFVIDPTPPYQTIYTPTEEDSAELLTAEATDTAGQRTQFSVAVRIARAVPFSEDRPPRVVLDSPTQDQQIPTKGIALAARAADDRGVAFVRFLHGARKVCDDKAPPYACTYHPDPADVGRIVTFTAVAVDTSEQTQGAISDNRVARYTPPVMTLYTGRPRRGGGRSRFPVRGRVKVPDAITVTTGCAGGKVRVRARRGARTVAIIAPILDSTCRYRATLSVPGRGRVRISASFLGNALLGKKSSKTLTRQAG